MKKNNKAAAVIAAFIMLAMSGCDSHEVEYDCEFCEQTFTSGGSVSTLYDGSEVALCDDCMNRVKMNLVEEYYEGLY